MTQEHQRRFIACGLRAVFTIGAATLGLGAGASGAAASRQYIVQLDPAHGNASERREEVDHQVARFHGDVERSFDQAINGMVVTLPDQVPASLDIPGVVSIEEDTRLTADATQQMPPWNLDRLDQRALPLSHSFSYLTTGEGVTAYIIDTGIRATHTDFGGRARAGYDVFGSDGADCNGHGTRVAGTLGGSTYGVAKRVALVGVRTLDCDGSGTISQVIEGIEWVVRDHPTARPAVANFSLGTEPSRALDSAIASLIDDGVTVAVAAGNDASDACTQSPARVGRALTVAASDDTDTFAWFSNHGRCVDLIAPGVGVTSDGVASDTATVTDTGTSMATPHVAGTAARLLQVIPTATPAQISDGLTALAAPRRITGIPPTCVKRRCVVTTRNLLVQAIL